MTSGTSGTSSTNTDLSGSVRKYSGWLIAIIVALILLAGVGSAYHRVVAYFYPPPASVTAPAQVLPVIPTLTAKRQTFPITTGDIIWVATGSPADNPGGVLWSLCYDRGPSTGDYTLYYGSPGNPQVWSPGAPTQTSYWGFKSNSILRNAVTAWIAATLADCAKT